MLKTNQKEFKVEEVTKRKGDKLYVKWIDKKDIKNIPKPKSLERKVKVELVDSSYYVTKEDLRNWAGPGIFKCTKKLI